MPQNYQWTPPDSEKVHTGANDPGEDVPAGRIRQTAWSSPAQRPPELRPPDLDGVWVVPQSPWQPVIWRWADTWRRESVQRVLTTDGFPVHRFELSPCDKASPGTSGDRPRAELFSVDPAEKSFQRVPVSDAVHVGSLSDNQEYWAKFAVFVPSDFPPNHHWATLFQRKLDDRFFTSPVDPAKPNELNFMTWLTINVHQVREPGPPPRLVTKIDATVPGYPDWPGTTRGTSDRVICELDEIVGLWTQFTVHEKLASSPGGVADVTVEIPGQPARTVHLVEPNDQRATFPSKVKSTPPAPGKDVAGHFQYGYYRENGPSPHSPRRPASGVLYYTPLLFSRTGANPPPLP